MKRKAFSLPKCEIIFSTFKKQKKMEKKAAWWEHKRYPPHAKICVCNPYEGVKQQQNIHAHTHTRLYEKKDFKNHPNKNRGWASSHTQHKKKVTIYAGLFSFKVWKLKINSGHSFFFAST